MDPTRSRALSERCIEALWGREIGSRIRKNPVDSCWERKRACQGHKGVEVDEPRAETYARLPRELTRPISFGFKSGTRPTPPACRRQYQPKKSSGVELNLPLV